MKEKNQNKTSKQTCDQSNHQNVGTNKKSCNYKGIGLVVDTR